MSPDAPPPKNESDEDADMVPHSFPEKSKPELLFSSDPMSSDPPTTRRTAMAEANAVRTSEAEPGIERFCTQSFVNPSSTRAGSQALIAAFDDSGLWLSSLIQPTHLVAELRQSCCLLSRVIITQWTRQGELHKLAKLADAIQDAKPPVKTHEAGQILTLIASLLGLIRPTPASRWLESGKPMLKDSVDPHLLQEASQWITLGRIIESLSHEDRLFWNRRLREPEHEWEWESPQSRAALRRLAPLLPAEGIDLSVFRATVPGVWWDLRWDPPTLASEYGKPATVNGKTSSHGVGTFALGLLSGFACTVGGLWFFLQNSDSLAHHSTAAITTSTSKEITSPAPKPQATTPSSTAPVALTAVQKEIDRLKKANPSLERLHSLVKAGTLRESETHVQGRTPFAAQGSKDHHILLQWLLLDPPNDPQVRRLVGKIALRALSPTELIETLTLSLYPGAPNATENRECAALLLELEDQNLTAAQRSALATLAKP